MQEKIKTSEIIYKITIPLPPITKKNSQQIIYNKKLQRAMIIQSKQYRKYEKSCKEYIKPIKTIAEPVEIKCLFYMPTRRRVDLTNLEEAIDDILVKYKIIDDDNYKILVSHDGSRVYYDKENPRTEIEIRRVENV